MDPWIFWRENLKNPKYILAPMVDHSELPWRMLSRELGCHAAYTPMFHAANFATSKKYRNKYFSTCDQDRPLIVQFCANDPEILVQAANHISDQCDAIDINLGCPQEIARRGHYGAFLQDDWTLIERMVKNLVEKLGQKVGISCKIRRFDTIKKTVEYAKMLERAGCTFIGVHGRTREQRGCLTGLADWDHIKAVKEALNIPVIANGNIQSQIDAENCLAYTGADAIMTAEGNLYNPSILLNKHPLAWEMATKYLDYIKLYPIPPGMAKSHLFKLFHKCISIEDNSDLRSKLGQANSLDMLYDVIDMFKRRYAYGIDDKEFSIEISTLPIPPFMCQPHYRYESQAKNNISLQNDQDSDAVKIKCGDLDVCSEVLPDETCQKRIKLASS